MVGNREIVEIMFKENEKVIDTRSSKGGNEGIVKGLA